MAHPMIEAAIDRYLIKERSRPRGVNVIGTQFTNNGTAIKAGSGTRLALDGVSFVNNGNDLDLGDDVALDAREISTERSA
jgi:hypothetical protein